MTATRTSVKTLAGKIHTDASYVPYMGNHHVSLMSHTEFFPDGYQALQNRPYSAGPKRKLAAFREPGELAEVQRDVSVGVGAAPAGHEQGHEVAVKRQRRSNAAGARRRRTRSPNVVSSATDEDAGVVRLRETAEDLDGTPEEYEVAESLAALQQPCPWGPTLEQQGARQHAEGREDVDENDVDSKVKLGQSDSMYQETGAAAEQMPATRRGAAAENDTHSGTSDTSAKSAPVLRGTAMAAAGGGGGSMMPPTMMPMMPPQMIPPHMMPQQMAAMASQAPYCAAGGAGSGTMMPFMFPGGMMPPPMGMPPFVPPPWAFPAMLPMMMAAPMGMPGHMYPAGGPFFNGPATAAAVGTPAGAAARPASPAATSAAAEPNGVTLQQHQQRQPRKSQSQFPQAGDANATATPPAPGKAATGHMQGMFGVSHGAASLPYGAKPPHMMFPAFPGALSGAFPMAPAPGPMFGKPYDSPAAKRAAPARTVEQVPTTEEGLRRVMSSVDLSQLKSWVLHHFCEEVYLMLLDVWRPDSPRARDAVLAYRQHVERPPSPDCGAFLVSVFGLERLTERTRASRVRAAARAAQPAAAVAAPAAATAVAAAPAAATAVAPAVAAAGQAVASAPVQLV